MSNNNKHEVFKGGFSIQSALWDFQQSSLFTDMIFCCIDGTVPVHKAMVVGVLKLLGVSDHEQEEADCVIVPGAMVADLVQALEDVYLKTEKENLIDVCMAKSIKLEYKDAISQITVKPEMPSEDEDYVNTTVDKYDSMVDMKQEVSEPEYFPVRENNKTPRDLTNPLNAKYPNRPKHIQRIQSLICEYCDHIARDKERLKKHKIFYHENLKHFCDYCDFKTALGKDLKLHRDEVHPDWKLLKKLQKIKCEQCDFVAKRPERLIGHIKREHGPKYPCDECNKIFLDPEKLQSHKLSAHDKTVRQCDQCAFQTTCKISLRAHIRTKHTHADVIYFCDQCDFKAKNTTNLKKHVETKHEGRRYYCEQCEYSAPYSGGLLRHIKMVHEKITYQCDFCEHRSTTRSNLKLHVDAKHLGVRYPCDMCDYQGSQPGSLKIHKQTRHPEAEYLKQQVSNVSE